MYKLNEKQIEVLKAKGLYEGFFDKLKKAVKDITDSDLKKIAKKRDKKVADFLSDFTYSSFKEQLWRRTQHT